MHVFIASFYASAQVLVPTIWHLELHLATAIARIVRLLASAVRLCCSDALALDRSCALAKTRLCLS
jgi:hypothetical protein